MALFRVPARRSNTAEATGDPGDPGPGPALKPQDGSNPAQSAALIPTRIPGRGCARVASSISRRPALMAVVRAPRRVVEKSWPAPNWTLTGMPTGPSMQRDRPVIHFEFSPHLMRAAQLAPAADLARFAGPGLPAAGLPDAHRVPRWRHRRPGAGRRV